MNRRYLDKNDVPEFLRHIGGYNGRKFDAVICSEVTFTGTNWDGGSRSRYTAVCLNGRVGRSFGGSDMPPPWSNPVEGKTVQIPPGYVVAEHSIFRGKDMGLTFYVRPEDTAGLLPAESDAVSRNELIVLVFTGTYKNTYGGRTNIRFEQAAERTGISADAWEASKAALIESGHLRKNGSITPKGRNAAGNTREYELS